MRGAEAGPAPGRLLDPARLTDADLQRWRQLASAAVEPSPCHEPGAVLPAVRHLPGGDRLRLLVVEHDSRWLACHPVRPATFSRRAPVPVLSTWVHPYLLIGSPLVAADATVPALQALLRTPWRARRGALLWSVEDLGDAGPLAAALEEAVAGLGGQVVRWEEHERAVLVRGDPANAGRGGSTARRARRARRAMDRELGPVQVVDVSTDPGAVDRFLALESAGWKGRAGTALAARSGDTAFFREVCAAFAAEGRLEIRSLRTAMGEAAMQTALHAGGSAFHFKTAYDESLADFSPGVQLLVDYRDTLAGGPVDLRDSCTAQENRTESRVWSGRRRIAWAVVPFAGPGSRATLAMLKRARTARAGHVRHRSAYAGVGGAPG
ncbi:GNAT family N-acetyltransferase [Kineosporiaceae bacterium SCSIO 59966]|nr:GNAT family N-acetyltransferase [Kineosporiaceae bacterium SCSIO 59966]